MFDILNPPLERLAAMASHIIILEFRNTALKSLSFASRVSDLADRVIISVYPILSHTIIDLPSGLGRYGLRRTQHVLTTKFDIMKSTWNCNRSQL